MNFLLFEVINAIILGLAVLVIFTAILINFIESRTISQTKKEKKSIVETGTMILFFLFFYAIIRFRIGNIPNNDIPFRLSLMFICWIIIILGIYFNIKGRFALGKNWANQIRIYKKQTFVTNGVYGIVRHPLYASLIWMFYAASILYLNYIAFLMNTLIFIPFMYYRAKQEEQMLRQQFKNYKEYANKVGMFFPKLKR